jgi:hypothetical protein
MKLIINLEPDDDVDIEGSGTTIREFLMKHLDNKGNALFHSMEHTNTYDVYRLLFDETNSIQPRVEQSDFCKKHFAGFVKNSIPSIIDTSHLHQPPKGRQNNKVQPFYCDIARGHGRPDNDSDVTSPTAAETATQQTRQRTATSHGPQVSPTQQDGPNRLPSEGARSGLANMKRKLAEIDKEREKFINSQQKIKDDVSEMTDSSTKMSGDMVNLRKDLSDLSEIVGRQMKELK